MNENIETNDLLCHPDSVCGVFLGAEDLELANFFVKLIRCAFRNQLP